MPGQHPSGAGQFVLSGRLDFADLRERRRAGSHTARRGVRGRLASLASALSAVTMLTPVASAQERAGASIVGLGASEMIQIAIFAGAMGAALIFAVWMIRERGRIAGENADLRDRVADLNAALSRNDALLNLRDQRVIVWSSGNQKPELVGSLPAESGAPEERGAFLALGRWLKSRSAALLDNAVAALREDGQSFDLIVESQNNTLFEAQGRRNAAHALVRFTALGEVQKSEARLRLENGRMLSDLNCILDMLNALDMPAWLRDENGGLRWVNRAFSRAVEVPGPQAAVDGSREFLSTATREAIAREHAERPVFAQKVSTVVEGDRRQFIVTDVAGAHGSAGIAADTSAVEAIREQYEKAVRSHADTLDGLATAVAIFDRDTKLRFFNQAFVKLWDLDLPFLHSAPDNALLLDRLRAGGKIAEQPEWRRWKENLLEAYRAVESQEGWWHLPDGRTLRVMANPQPAGGVTWVFENVTEQMDLESRYQTAVRVQTETLDGLNEGVAVFGPDGRARLFNPAFGAMWGLSPGALATGTHIAALKSHGDRLVAGGEEKSPWTGFVASVTGFDEARRDRSGECELANGTVLRFAVIHLPNGQVMMTFVDVTDTVKVERALKDKNEALERADRLKNDFVQHVSYELRSPLTNIIGFTELLTLPGAEPLKPQQREYVGHIGSSSAVLLTIINDILDLATIDAGIMELEIAPVPVDATIGAAAELLTERLAEHGIALKVDAGSAPLSFSGDETRVRQILYNLLSNAVNYAPEASTVTLSCRALLHGVEFAVHDDGPGMAPDVLDTVFRRFEPRSNGGRRRGAGLGLSVVKSFVELHGGTVRIETGEAKGTTVICFFPGPVTPRRTSSRDIVG